MEIDRHRFEIRELHHGIQRMFAATCANKGIHLEIRVADDVPRFAFGDSYRLRQILTNLVANGLKFTEKGQVVVGLETIQNKPGTFQCEVRSAKARSLNSTFR